MSKRPRPAKPSEPLGMIQFPKHGQPFGITELLPSDPKELEESMVLRFIKALNEEGHHLHEPVPADPWPDFVTEEEGERIGIEVVEVVDRGDAERRGVQRAYEREVSRLLGEDLKGLGGLDILLDDNYQDPGYPPLVSRAGKELAAHIAEELRALLDRARALPMGELLFDRWRQSSGQPRTGAAISRVSSSASGHPARPHFGGTFPHTIDESDRVLADSIVRKLKRGYGSFAGALWLLAYQSPGTAFTERSLLVASHAIEAHPNHPFDAIWYIWPIPQGSLRPESVWRRVNATEG